MERDRVRAALVAAGLSLPRKCVPGQLTVAERDALAERVSGGTPLSQIVIEERESPPVKRMAWRLWYHITRCECHWHATYGWVIHTGCRIHDR